MSRQSEIIVSTSGFKFLAVDLQHGLASERDAFLLRQIIGNSGIGAAVRVRKSDFSHIGKCLDMGFTTVICPMMSTVEQVKELAEACYYPPIGTQCFMAMCQSCRNPCQKAAALMALSSQTTI